MNKIKKKIFMYIVSCVLLTIACSSTVGASTENNSDSISENFRTLIIGCYTNASTVSVLDTNANEISSRFLNDNYNAYISGDFLTIKQYVNNNVTHISYAREEDGLEGSQTYALTRSKTVYHNGYARLVPKGITSPVDAYYTFYGNFHYDPNTMLITALGNSGFSNIRYDKPGGLYVKAYRMSTNPPKLINNGYTAVFSGTISFGSYVDLTYLTLAEDYGSFGAQVVGTGH